MNSTGQAASEAVTVGRYLVKGEPHGFPAVILSGRPLWAGSWARLPVELWSAASLRPRSASAPLFRRSAGSVRCAAD